MTFGKNKIENKIVIADISSIRKENENYGHFLYTAKMFSEVIGKDTMIAGGPVYLDKVNNLISLKYDNDVENMNKSLYKKIKKKFSEIFNVIQLNYKCKHCKIVYQHYSTMPIILGLVFSRNNENYLIQYNSHMTNNLFRMLFNLIKRRISGILCPLKEIGEAYNIPYLVIDDYLYTFNELKTNEKYMVKYDYGFVGLITDGKDIEGFIEQVIETGKTCLIAGYCKNRSRASNLKNIIKYDNKIVYIDKYLDSEEYNRCIMECKYIVLPYNDNYNSGSSGVIFDAIFRCKPVIVPKKKFSNFVCDNQLGICYDDIKSINLDEILDEKEYEKYINNIESYLIKYKDKIAQLKKFLNVDVI